MTKLQDSGIVLVDKPEGMSSAHVVNRIKRIFQVKKAGHTGTLDPFATGLMVVTLNRATRISRYYLGGDKSYEATLRLGSTTDTLDPTGQVVATAPVPLLTKEEILAAFSRFTGPILQKPPVYSALKHEGKPLYQHAREGRPVEKPPRPVTIHDIRLISFDLPEIRFAVSCSTGTYIRTLAADLAQEMGSVGHLTALRRTRTCKQDIQGAMDLEALTLAREENRLAPCVLPMAAALDFLPQVTVNKALTEHVIHGKLLRMTDLGLDAPLASAPEICLLTPEGVLLAVVRPDSEDPGRFQYDAVFA